LPPGEVFAVEMRPQLLFNPDSRSPNFFLPGLTAILLLNVTTFLTAFAIVREKERGTLEQLFVTPVRPFGLLLGKLLPYFGIGFFELCLIVTSMRFIFRVPIHGSVLLLAFLSLPYIFVSLSLGILISSKAETQSQAMQLAFLTILPSIFFSGYIFPRETMPVVFRAISYLVPASYFINITRGIILRGAGLRHLWTDGLALFAIGLFAARRLRPGGLLVISVPAYKQLWSYWDDILGHRRRYTTGSLRQVAQTAGFRVRKVSYSNATILAPVALVRAVKGVRHHAVQRAYAQGFTAEPSTPETDFIRVPGWLNRLMTGYYQLESRTVRNYNLPFGLSVVCVAQKPSGITAPVRLNGRVHGAADERGSA